jgi:outer membrane protein assembly factor BamE (lipoprotein component of BamABCDE complex)
MRRLFLICTVLAGALNLVACAPTVMKRGHVFDSDAVAQLKKNEATRDSVITALGTPTLVAPFDPNVWYYVGRTTAQESFFDPTVTDQRVVRVVFDATGVVKEVGDVDVARAVDVAPVDRRTPTYGSDATLVQQLIGNLGHPVPAASNKRSDGSP